MSQKDLNGWHHKKLNKNMLTKNYEVKLKRLPSLCTKLNLVIFAIVNNKRNIKIKIY